MRLTPRQKLVGAIVLAASVPLLAALQSSTAAGVARALLALATLGGLMAWLVRAKGGLAPGAFKAAPRLKVVQRVGLSQRSGLTLVEVDGRPYLVAHGDGFAKVRPLRRPTLVSRAEPLPVAPLPTLEEPS